MSLLRFAFFLEMSCCLSLFHLLWAVFFLTVDTFLSHLMWKHLYKPFQMAGKKMTNMMIKAEGLFKTTATLWHCNAVYCARIQHFFRQLSSYVCFINAFTFININWGLPEVNTWTKVLKPGQRLAMWQQFHCATLARARFRDVNVQTTRACVTH